MILAHSVRIDSSKAAAKLKSAKWQTVHTVVNAISHVRSGDLLIDLKLAEVFKKMKSATK